uniref:Uncharacterized protein n=1 Tax=Timema tahoe TaxID=61484 RepID=A0A7R9II60_9NEOP|nr:unnamed protein product [Timema tahoe]
MLDSLKEEQRDKYDEYKEHANHTLPGVHFEDMRKRLRQRSSRMKYLYPSEEEVRFQGEDNFRVNVYFAIMDKLLMLPVAEALKEFKSWDGADTSSTANLLGAAIHQTECIVSLLSPGKLLSKKLQTSDGFTKKQSRREQNLPRAAPVGLPRFRCAWLRRVKFIPGEEGRDDNALVPPPLTIPHNGNTKTIIFYVTAPNIVMKKYLMKHA